MQSILNATTEAEFFKILSYAAINLGFEKCGFGMRAPLPVSNPKVVLLNNYPTSWQEQYAQQNYLQIDPTVAHGMKSLMPIIWSDNLFSSCRPFWEEACANNLRVGWSQSVHDARGVGGLLSLVRSDDEISHSELILNSLKMSWLAQLAFEGLSKILISELLPEMHINLTTREIEVMRWTADGKTSSEVGQIMCISDSTVNFHVNNAVSKLGATNKTAAAIRATLLRLL